MPKKQLDTESSTDLSTDPASKVPLASRSVTICNQGLRFIEVARALGANEDEAAFKAKLGAIARQKPKGDVPKPQKDDDA